VLSLDQRLHSVIRRQAFHVVSIDEECRVE